MAMRRHIEIRGIPRVDPQVRYAGTTVFRSFSTEQIRKLKHTYVVHAGSNPVAVVMPYANYMALQEAAFGRPKENEKQKKGKTND
jgi:hypothetical protein